MISFARWLVLAAILVLPLRADAAPAPVVDPAKISAHYHDVLTRGQYQEIAEPPVNTRIEDWLSQWFRSLGARFGEFRYSSRMPAFESLLMTLLVAFAVGILLYIMVRLTRRRGRMKLDLDDEVLDPKSLRPPEDYDREIVAAVRAADWHTAYLAAWRQFLSRLEQRHLVDHDRTRTNREYLAQLRGKSLPPAAPELLGGLVDAYDRFIYGRTSIAEADWANFRERLDETALLLHLDVKIKPASGVAP